jgi:hypothetical protein
MQGFHQSDLEKFFIVFPEPEPCITIPRKRPFFWCRVVTQRILVIVYGLFLLPGDSFPDVGGPSAVIFKTAVGNKVLFEFLLRRGLSEGTGSGQQEKNAQKPLHHSKVGLLVFWGLFCF